MIGTTLTSNVIIEMYKGIFKDMDNRTASYSDGWDIKLPLLHIRYPRKLKKKNEET